MSLLLARARKNHMSSGPPVGTVAKGWRLHVLSVYTAPYTAMIELEFRAIVAGASLCHGGSGFASTTLAGWPVSNLYDGVKTGDTIWASNGSPDPTPNVGYLLPTASVVNQVLIVARSSATYQTPKDFKIQSSIDTTTGLDGTWIDEWSVIGGAAWSANEQRTFNR